MIERRRMINNPDPTDGADGDKSPVRPTSNVVDLAAQLDGAIRRKEEGKLEGLTELAQRAGQRIRAKQQAEEERAKQAQDEPQAKDEPEPEPETSAPESAEAEAEAEAEYVEDDTNAASNVQRKLWRLESALKFLKRADEYWLGANSEVVGATLKWMGQHSPDAACMIWVTVFGEDARGRFRGGFKGLSNIEAIYRHAQRKGWRYPITRNLNKLDEMVKRTEEALVRAGAEIYQAGDKLVRPVLLKVDATKGRKTTIAVLVVIDHAFLKTQLTAYVDYVKWVKNIRVGVEAPKDVVSGLLGRYGQWKFPMVTGIVSAPTLRRDGTVLMNEGWDPVSGLIMMGPLPKMPELAAKPSRADGLRAAKILEDELLSEFPFVSPADKSVAMSVLITPNVRAALTCAPMHATSAPEPGTGKRYLLDTSAVIAIGDVMPIVAAGKDIEEMEKRLNTKILQGVTLFSIDNVGIPIGGDTLCQIIERPTYSLRILGLTKGKDRRNTWTLCANGTNLRIKDDVTRRTLVVRMDAKMDQPQHRAFKNQPVERASADRGRYIWAALTLVLSYRAAGMPGRLASIGDPFAEWSDNVRSALVWLGYADPVETMTITREHDPNRQARMVILRAMFNAYGSAPRTAGEMIADAKAGTLNSGKGKLLEVAVRSPEADDLRAAIAQYTSDRLDAKYLGTKFTTDLGRITDGLTLRNQRNDHTKINVWWAEEGKPEPNEPDDAPEES